MNSNDDISTNTAATPVSGAGEKTKKGRKALIAWIAAGVLVLGGGGIAAAVGVSNYNAETARLCVAATDVAADAGAAAKTAQTAAAAALTAAEGTVLPDGGTSTKYADRAAVEAVKAQQAEGDKPAVEAVPARPSGQELIDSVTDAQAELTKAEKGLVSACETRDDAAAITAQVEAVQQSATALDSATEALAEDFELFQADEAARLAAEAAAAEAARIAAEQAEAEAAAAQAAAEQAAAQQQWVDPGYTDNQYSGGGDWAPPVAPPSSGGGGGGGNIGGNNGNGTPGCWTANCGV